MAQHGWSSLPEDLVNRVADCLLATNDIDCYTDLRAVCHHWRSVTVDPRNNQHDSRFRPSRWVMLDERKACSSAVTVDGALLFVNAITGRFLRRSLPLLHDGDRGCYVFITSTTDGLLVLEARDPPHAVSVLNPFIGSLIRFAAPLPSNSGLQLTAVVVGSSPTLVLVSIEGSLVYWAEPRSESFFVEKNHGECPASRLPQIAAAGKCAAVNREFVLGAQNNFDQFYSDVFDDCRCYGVTAAGGGMLAILKWRRHGVEVFKIDAAGNVVDRMKSIGSQALFLGVRCLVVDTDRFPTVEPNCAYFQLRDYLDERYIYKFTIGRDYDHEQGPELVSAAMGDMRPLTLTHLLCNYTMDIPISEYWLPRGKRSSDLEVDGKDYIDYVEDSDEDYEYQSSDED